MRNRNYLLKTLRMVPTTFGSKYKKVKSPWHDLQQSAYFPNVIIYTLSSTPPRSGTDKILSIVSLHIPSFLHVFVHATQWQLQRIASPITHKLPKLPQINHFSCNLLTTHYCTASSSRQQLLSYKVILEPRVILPLSPALFNSSSPH